jgi:uncharacterized membrane protein
MKKIAVTVIALTFVFTVASLSFAANEFQMKGIITKINGNQITIKDDKGKEITVESNVSYIKVGNPILLYGQILRPLTAEDIEFLTKQCQVAQVDVDIIPQLQKEGQADISKWAAAKDCKKLTPFKATRNYYRQLKPGARLPMPPAGWSFEYLTEEEFLRYSEILEKAPL